MRDRRYDIDWLRVGATYLLFFFHVGKVFDEAPYYHIKNTELSHALDYVTGFIHLWHMRLFFFLAGWSIYASLSKRGTGGVLLERVRRLFLPFAFGVAVFCLPISYIENVAIPGEDIGFRAFIPQFWSSLEYFTWCHLWFLIYLFTFTVLYFPLLTWIERSTSDIKYVRGWVVYLPLIPLALIQVGLRWRWPGFQNLYDDWANFAYYSAFFILGFLFARFPALEDAGYREWKRAGVLGLVAAVVMGLLPWETWVVTSYLIGQTLSAVAGWGIVLGLLGLARTYLNFGNRTLSYLAESALPIYILHQAGIVFPGYFICRMDAGIAVKFVLLLAVATVVTVAAYHFLVRPCPPLRFVFGMRRKERAKRKPA